MSEGIVASAAAPYRHYNSPALPASAGKLPEDPHEGKVIPAEEAKNSSGDVKCGGSYLTLW